MNPNKMEQSIEKLLSLSDAQLALAIATTTRSSKWVLWSGGFVLALGVLIFSTAWAVDGWRAALSCLSTVFIGLMQIMMALSYRQHLTILMVIRRMRQSPVSTLPPSDPPANNSPVSQS